MINSLKTHNSDGTSGNTKRTVKFANIGNDANSVFANNSARHGLAIIKYDADDYNSAKASMQVANGSYPEPQGDATLVGATYEIYNRNNYAVMVDTNNDHKGDTKVEANRLCATITTVVDTTSNIEYVEWR